MQQNRSRRQDAASQDRPTSSRTTSRAPTPSPRASRRSSPHPNHIPNTPHAEECVYILTLSLTPSIAHPLNEMRTRYFPKHLNRTPAHVTLFHALPHSQIDAMTADLESLCMSTKPYHVSTGRPFRMRRGVAVLLGSGDEQSQHFREDLRERWEAYLSEQDRGVWHPHWTVMNKVDEEKKVEQAFCTLRRVLFDDVQHGKAVGVELWRYDDGNWQAMREFRFAGSAKSPGRSLEGDDEGYFDAKPRGRGDAKGVKSPGERMVGIWKSFTKQKKGVKDGDEQ